MQEFAMYLASAIRMATPLLIAALGLIISERAGLMNIGVEGIMLMGAFSAYAATSITGSYWIGLITAMIAGGLLITIFAVMAISVRAEQVVVGAAMNIFCTGLSGFLYRRLFYGSGNAAENLSVATFQPIPIPVLSKIPIVGDVLFNHNIIVYFGFLMVIVLTFIMKKTSWGLKIISVGEHPKAAESLGISVIKVRYLATIFSGIMMGAAGAYLSIAQSNAFAEKMTSGKGFIAMAVVILGKWNPWSVLAGALIFGGANAVQMNIQNIGVDIPNNLIMMIPYIVTVIAVVALKKNKVGAPGAQGIPYTKA